MKKLFVLISILFYSCYGVSQSFEGIWRGSIVVQGMELPLVFEWENDSNKWVGTMQSPAQTQTKMPFTKVEIRNDSVFAEINSFKISYKGSLNREDNEIIGLFQQGGLQSKLILRKGEYLVKLNRPQEPRPPYSYDTLNVKFANEIDNIKLAGTISRPQGEGKFPAVILVTGSGPQNRDEEIMNHKPFKVIADYLTKHGIVVLRYDDRGVGESSGNFVQANVGDFSKDAIAALNFLRKQPFVDTTNVGIVGHSEGGLIAFLLAGQQIESLKFGVSLAGPSISIDSLMVLQLYQVGKVAGMKKADLEKARAINRVNFDIIKSDISSDQAFAMLMDNMKEVSNGNGEALQQEIHMMLMQPYRYFIRIDPLPFIQQINIPVFAAFGEKDIQVPHVENMESLADHLPKNKKSIIKTYPGLNHLFQPAKTGSIAEYREIETTIDQAVLQDMVEWIKSL